MEEILYLDKVKVVLTSGQKNYVEIFDSLDRTDHLYITTFNYSMPQDLDESLQDKIEFINDVRVIFNVYHFDGKEEEKVYKLLVQALKKNPYVQFFYNSNNHSKIISSGKKMYIGSSNLTENAVNNFEAGVIITDNDIIKKIEQTVFDFPHLKYKAIFTDPIAPLIIPYQFLVVEAQKEFEYLRTLIDTAKGNCYGLSEFESIDYNILASKDFFSKFHQTFCKAIEELVEFITQKENGFMIEILSKEIVKELELIMGLPPLGTSTVNFFSFIEDYRNTLDEYKDHYWRTQTYKADTVILEEDLYLTRLKSLLDMFLHLRKTWIDINGVKQFTFLDNRVPVSFWYEEPSMAESYWSYFLK